LADAGVTAYSAVQRVIPKLRGSSTAVVIGVGGLGGFAVQFLRQLSLTNGYGAEAVLDFVGVDATMGLALQSARAGGGIAIVGAGGGTASIGWGLLPSNCELFIQFGGTTADLHDVVSLAEAGRIQIDVQHFHFEQTAEAYQRVGEGTVAGRAVVTVT
jgi:propanol-preferring alcohol dehydrogenase